MVYFLQKTLLLFPLLGYLFSLETLALESSVQAHILFRAGWEIEEVFVDQNKFTDAIVVLMIKGDEKSFVCEDKILAQGKIPHHLFEFTGEKNNFLLKVTYANNKQQLLTHQVDLGTWSNIIIPPRFYGTFPPIILENNEAFTLYENGKKHPPIIGKNAEFLLYNRENCLIQIKLHSISHQGKWKQSLILIENSKSTQPLAQLLDYGITPQGEIRYLVEELEGDTYFKIGEKISPNYHSGGHQRAKADTTAQKAIPPRNYYPLQNKTTQKWHLYLEGILIGNFDNCPQGLKIAPDGELLYADYNQEKERWFWKKDNIAIIDSDYYEFEPQDIHFYQSHYALIRKIENEYEIYANFEKRVRFRQKPTLEFISENLIKISGRQVMENEEIIPFYAIYQLNTDRLFLQPEPINCHTFEGDFFDFWLENRNIWTGYREGTALGQIKTAKKEELLAFVIRKSLFFPQWNHNNSGKVRLQGEAGILGSFDTLYPLERPEQRESDSRLYSSFLATNSEGVTAFYGDVIVGPADTIIPNLDPENPHKVLGLYVDFAYLRYYYTIEKGMNLLEDNTPEEKQK